MYAKTYVFEKLNAQKVNTDSRSKVVEITGEILYCTEQGYGFVTKDNCNDQESMQLPELNSGFVPACEYAQEGMTRILFDDYGCFVAADDDAGQIPLCFKADVDRCGNYEVTLELYCGGEILIFSGTRRLVYKASLQKEQKLSVGFILNVCDMIPKGRSCLYEHRSVDIAMIGNKVHLQKLSIRQVNCPTIYIAGDSIVNDQAAFYPYMPQNSYCGWGQMLPIFLNSKVAVSNHAHSGQTVETFRTEGHYAIIQANIRFGDYLLIQFSDQDKIQPGLEMADGYTDAIARYIEEIRAIGAYPVLVTPMCGNTWNHNGDYVDLTKEYADICKNISKRYQVPVIDMHETSRQFILSKGRDETAQYFYPGDDTHTNDYGAYLMAGLAVENYQNQVKKGYADAYSRFAGYINDRYIDIKK